MEHFPSFLDIAFANAETGVVDKSVQYRRCHAAANAFCDLYNVVAQRIDASQEAHRRVKAKAVLQKAAAYFKAFKEAFGSDAVTPYTHTMYSHIVDMVLNSIVDIMDLSAQSLEHLNKW